MQSGKRASQETNTSDTLTCDVQLSEPRDSGFLLKLCCPWHLAMAGQWVKEISKDLPGEVRTQEKVEEAVGREPSDHSASRTSEESKKTEGQVGWL